MGKRRRMKLPIYEEDKTEPLSPRSTSPALYTPNHRCPLEEKDTRDGVAGDKY